MVSAGIEAINIFGGSAVLDVGLLADHRGLDRKRFDNLMISEKSVALPIEDPVTYAVNAAQPLINALSPEEKDRIEMLIVCSESGIDFGKSMSTYVHKYLELNKNCRLFEIKQACYSGTAGLQNAVNFILSKTSSGAKALVITSDISRYALKDDEKIEDVEWSYAEPSGGAGAVAMLVSEKPDIFAIDIGANGYYGYEVMDTCRPIADSEVGDPDLSLLSYLDCLEQSFNEYSRRVKMAEFKKSFGYLSFHTPFGGMVKGAHRTMMRKLYRSNPEDIESDFERRMSPGIKFCLRTGNSMASGIFISLASTIHHAKPTQAHRVGCFSYGSGCCSEFYSGIITPEAIARVKSMKIDENLDARYKLNMDEYDDFLKGSNQVLFGTKNYKFSGQYDAIVNESHHRDKNTLILDEVKNYERLYRWI